MKDDVKKEYLRNLLYGEGNLEMLVNNYPIPFEQEAEMYLSIKIKDKSGRINKEKTFATVEKLTRPLMEQAKNDENKRLILEKAAENQGYLLLVI